MSRVCRVCPRRALHLARAGLAGISLLFAASDVFAQSSVGRAANTATGQSLRDAVEQIQQEIIDREVFGEAGAFLGAGAAPGGRLRGSRHDALEVSGPDTENFAWSTREASAFATGSYTMPGVVMGGQLKLSIFGGYNWLSLKMKNGGGNTLSTADGQFGEAENESGIVGAIALWSRKNTYLTAAVVGMWGETTLTDAIDFCGPPCIARRYQFDTAGFVTSATAGQVFALSGSPAGPMLDLRGSLGYTQNTGDTFANFQGDEQTWTFSTWTLTGSATLFANVPLQNASVLRPYVQAYVRQELDYRNKLHFHLNNGEVGNVYYDQAHTYGGADLGLTYAIGKMTLGAALYYEASADDRTFGGRVGASWKLN